MEIQKIVSSQCNPENKNGGNEGFKLLNIKIYENAMIIKTVQHGQKNKQIDGTETNPYMYSQLMYEKDNTLLH